MKMLHVKDSKKLLSFNSIPNPFQNHDILKSLHTQMYAFCSYTYMKHFHVLNDVFKM